MKKDNRKYQSNLDFKLMTFFFKIRDLFRDPMEKVKNAEIKPGNVVVDYGCGPGSHAVAAAQIVGSSGKVHAIDIHPLALQKVKKKAEKKGLDNIETIKTDCKIQLEDNSIDIITCFDVIHELDDLTEHLKEFHRILKLNALLAVDDHHLSESDIVSLITQNNWFEFIKSNQNVYIFKKI